MEQGHFTVITSMVSLLEVLVHPFRFNNTKLVEEYRDILLRSKNLTTIVISTAIAEEAARLRASYNIRTPDAIQLATAINGGASFFLNNDDRLPALPNLSLITLDTLVKD